MAGDLFYSIDISALIHWWDEAYSPEQVPGLVPLVAALVSDGRLRATRTVKDEIAPGPLLEWCKRQDGLFTDEDAKVQAFGAALLAQYPVKARSIKGADPFVNSLAKVSADVTDNVWKVVSAEAMRGPDKGVSIPWACRDHGIQHIGFFQMWKEEGWVV